jgi:hypothetical protein
MVYIFAGAWVRSVGANVSSEINTAIITIDLEPSIQVLFLLTSLRAAIL